MQELGVTVHKADELTCLVAGINFLLRHFDAELYRVDHATFMYVHTRMHACTAVMAWQGDW